MKKKANWYDDLFIYLEENKDKPFKWGSWDCCRFSNGAIKAMTGKTMIPSEVKWTSKVSALKAIKKYGVRKGLRLTLKRISSCHPWGGHGYDPVP